MRVVHFRGHTLALFRSVQGVVQPRLLFSVADDKHIQYLVFYGDVPKSQQAELDVAMLDNNYDFDVIGTHVGGAGSIKDFSSKRDIDEIPYKDGAKGTLTIGSNEKLGKDVHWVMVEFDKPYFKLFFKFQKAKEYATLKEVSGMVMKAGRLGTLSSHPERIPKDVSSYFGGQ